MNQRRQMQPCPVKLGFSWKGNLVLLERISFDGWKISCAFSPFPARMPFDEFRDVSLISSLDVGCRKIQVTGNSSPWRVNLCLTQQIPPISAYSLRRWLPFSENNIQSRCSNVQTWCVSSGICGEPQSSECWCVIGDKTWLYSWAILLSCCARKCCSLSLFCTRAQSLIGTLSAGVRWVET